MPHVNKKTLEKNRNLLQTIKYAMNKYHWIGKTIQKIRSKKLKKTANIRVNFPHVNKKQFSNW